MRRIVLSLLLLALGVPSGSLLAQQRVVMGRAPTGWIGISYEIITTSPDAEPSDPALAAITEVVDGSPAEEVGIHVGDTIVEIDGEPVSFDEFAALSQRLRPGLVIELTLRRRGRTREVSIEAGSRPGYRFTRGDVVLHMDSVAGLITAQLDSLKLSWGPEGLGGTARFLSFDSSGNMVTTLRDGESLRGAIAGVEIGPGSVEFLVREGRGGVLGLAEVAPPRDFFEYEFVFPDPHEAFPFELYLVQSQETDSLRQTVRQIREELARSQAEQATRYRMLAARMRGRTEQIEEDEELQRLRKVQEALTQQLHEHQTTLSEVSRQEMQRQWQHADRAFAEAARERDRDAEYQTRTREEDARRRFEDLQEMEQWERQRRPLSEYYMGLNFIAGAQITSLNPGLAEYFGVGEGVLVTEVAKGTPAEEAGIESGDVIVSVGDRPVTSLEELRMAMGAWDRPMVLTVIRKQREVEISIRDYP
ncbi:PDZ domain-containing protein [Gemmatimonadota bacterium]